MLRYWTAIIIILVAPGCFRAGEEADSVDAAPYPELTRAFEAHRHELDSYPKGSRSGAALEDVFRVAKGVGKDDLDPGPFFCAAVEFRDHDVGLAFVDEMSRRVMVSGGDLSLLSELWSTYPDSRVGAKAADLVVGALVDDEVLVACQAIVDGAPGSGAAFIARLRRAEHFRESGRSHLAAHDGVHLLARFPGRVERANLAPFIQGVLESCGLRAEAVLAETLGPEEGVAALLLAEIERLPQDLWDVDRAAGPMNASELYFRYSMKTEEMVQAADDVVDAKLEMARLFLRLAFVAIFEDDMQVLLSRLHGYLEQTVELSDAEIMSQDVMVLTSMSQALSSVIEKTDSWNRMTKSGFSRRKQRRGQVEEVRGALSRVHDRNLELLSLRLEVDRAQSGTDLGVHVDQLAQYALAVGRYGEAGKVYLSAAEAAVDSGRAAHYFFEAGEVYRTLVEDSRKAIECFERLLARCSDNGEAPGSRMQLAVLYYELGQFERALEHAQDLAHFHADHKLRPAADFVSATCLHALGAGEEAGEVVRELSSAFPQSPVAPKALEWQGQVCLGHQDFDEAAEIFEIIVERYPSSSQGKRAREYLVYVEEARESQLDRDT